MIRHCYRVLGNGSRKLFSTSRIEPKPALSFDDHDIDVDDPLPLVTEILQSEGGECNPSVLVKKLRELWISRSLDQRRMPSSIEFARFNSAIFDIVWENVCTPTGSVQKNATLIRLRPKALEAAKQGRLRRVKHPDPYLWAPIIRHELEKAGGYMSLAEINHSLQEISVTRGLPLPPLGLSWFALSPHPAYAFFRPVWGQQTSSKRSRKLEAKAANGLTIQGKGSLDTTKTVASKLEMSARGNMPHGNNALLSSDASPSQSLPSLNSIRTVIDANNIATNIRVNRPRNDTVRKSVLELQGEDSPISESAKKTYRKQLGALSYWVIGVSLCQEKTALEMDFEELHAYAKSLHESNLA